MTRVRTLTLTLYQDDPGQTECKECTLGHACPSPSAARRGRSLAVAGSVSPVECARGSYSDRKDLSECKPCEAGRYCAAGLPNPNPNPNPDPNALQAAGCPEGDIHLEFVAGAGHSDSEPGLVRR